LPKSDGEFRDQGLELRDWLPSAITPFPKKPSICHGNLSNGQKAKLTHTSLSPAHIPLGIYFTSEGALFQEPAQISVGSQRKHHAFL